MEAKVITAFTDRSLDGTLFIGILSEYEKGKAQLKYYTVAADATLTELDGDISRPLMNSIKQMVMEAGGYLKRNHHRTELYSY